MKLFGIYGASGCGRGMMPLARLNAQSEDRYVFVDDGVAGQTVNGNPVLSFEDFLGEDCAERRVAVAVADPATRQKIVARCEAANVGFFTVASPHCVIMDDVSIGEGALLSPFTVLTSNISIGRHFHCNIQSYVEHDCVIGDFVTFAPGVRCNGNVVIGDGAYIGAGAIIKQGRSGAPLRIGANAIVGMGAIVTRDVPANSVVMGNPARVR